MKILKVLLRKMQGRRAQVALPTMVAFWSLDGTKKEAKCPFRTV